jgi:hypothetical protein
MTAPLAGVIAAVATPITDDHKPEREDEAVRREREKESARVWGRRGSKGRRDKGA